MLRLPDGTPVAVRPLVAEDRGWLAAAVAELSPESRYRRFLAPLRTLSEAMLVRLVDEVDGVDHVALIGVLNPDSPQQARSGLVRFVRLAAAPDTAEFAITVADVAQGRGLGRLLSRAAAQAATARGIRHFTATVGADNAASLALLRRLGQTEEQRLSSPGVVELRVALPGPAAASV